MGLFTSSIQGGKLSFAYAPRGDSQRRHSERSEESPPFMFWVEFEEGHFPSSNIGDPSQMRLGVTQIGKGENPFPTFPQSLKVVFGWIWRRTMPSSINGHVERSEESAIQSKGAKSPFQPTRSVVPNAFCEGSPNIGKGKKTPFPTDRILVVLSVAKDLRLISPERQKINFGRSWRMRLFSLPVELFL